MAEPTPEQWWASLSGADRVAFMDRVAMHSRAPFALWVKMRNAGMLAYAGEYAGESWETYLPEPFLRYVLARAAERS
jgi:hypothetical protein